MDSKLVESYEQLTDDIQKVNRISIVPTILEVICQTTGMGFAAIARVTKEKWIACSVKDDIQFGIKPGGELQIKTTICDEIRDSGRLVVIGNVSEDTHYCQHHTPMMYGFQSYISVPIVLKTGEFFGTLCAIDPRPAELNNSKTIGMFNLFADLISFHLQSLDLMEQSTFAIQDLNQQLRDSKDENRQYHFISNHNLQEPLRKIRVYSNKLMHVVEHNDLEKTKETAFRINLSAQRFSMMIQELSEFSRLSYGDHSFETVDLTKIIQDVCSHLRTPIEEKKASITAASLPQIFGVPLQMEQLFFHLISNALKFSKKEIPPVITISSKTLSDSQIKDLFPQAKSSSYVDIQISDNGIGMETEELQKIFHIFSKLNYEPRLDSFGIGLAYCRKVVHLHRGTITVQSAPQQGTTFSIILPQHQKV